MVSVTFIIDGDSRADILAISSDSIENYLANAHWANVLEIGKM